MGADLPEGLSRDDVRGHALTLAFAGTLINHVSQFYRADEGPSEEEAERALEEHVERIFEVGTDAASAVLMTLATIIVETGDVTSVQAWFDSQRMSIREVLGDDRDFEPSRG